jgi:ferredoxin-NADP reductase
MEKYNVKIKSINKVTSDVLRIVTEKPDGYDFTPGQATEISINKKGWDQKRNPFTFTCLPDKDFLEFHIKTYPSRKGMTNELLSLGKGDELILHDVFGAITYKGEGVFIAGGAGITPFICIFRHLQITNNIKSNKLIFANKTKSDIVLKEEFEQILGENFINILSNEDNTDGFDHGFITDDFLKEYIDESIQNIYLCGPPIMMDSVKKHLESLGINKDVITEEED